MMVSSQMDWYHLAKEHIEKMENIRLHHIIEMGKNLPEVLKSLDRNVKAMVLVNTEESYILPREMVKSANDIRVPLLIVKRSDGDEIFKYLKSHSEKKLYVQINPGDEYNKGIKQRRLKGEYHRLRVIAVIHYFYMHIFYDHCSNLETLFRSLVL